jgi:hypothetical protein
VLGIGGGPNQNLHVYTATAVAESDCSYLSQSVLDEIQTVSPLFKDHMRRCGPSVQLCYLSTPGTAVQVVQM